jgi:hypothetical protein
MRITTWTTCVPLCWENPCQTNSRDRATLVALTERRCSELELKRYLWGNDSTPRLLASSLNGFCAIGNLEGRLSRHRHSSIRTIISSPRHITITTPDYSLLESFHGSGRDEWHLSVLLGSCSSWYSLFTQWVWATTLTAILRQLFLFCILFSWAVLVAKPARAFGLSGCSLSGRGW